MTQKFAEDGTVIPVTKVTAGPCYITQIKNTSKDGYVAVQIGFGFTRNLSQPVKGHLKNLGDFRYLKEFRTNDEEIKRLAVGNKITVGTFKLGDVVKVTGSSKGRGFQGVVRRHGFHGSPATHGHKDQLRMPGSIGATGPAHVFKGTRMGGRMGGSQVTVSNLEIVDIDEKTNSIFIKGAVPGPRNNLILLYGDGEIIVEPGERGPLKTELKKSTEEKVEEVKDQTTPEEVAVEKVSDELQATEQEVKVEEKIEA